MSMFSGLNESDSDDPDRDFFNKVPYRIRTAYDDHPQLAKLSFVYRTVCKEYLKCDISPWKKKKKNIKENEVKDKDKISMDLLPTSFFDPDYSRGNVKMQFSLDGESYRRVVGYREIMIKREQSEYLEELKVKDEAWWEKCPSKFVNKRFPINPFWKLARGGGVITKKSMPTRPGGPKKKLGKIGAGGVKRKTGVGKRKTLGPANSAKSKQSVKEKGAPWSWKDFRFFVSNLTPTKKQLEEKMEKGTGTADLKDPIVKQWKWLHLRKRPPATPPPSHFGKYIILLHRLYRMPKEDEERNGEWLYLSSSSEEKDAISHFDKEHHRWMNPDLSFESQKLFRQLNLFWVIMLFSGRSFLHHRKNYYRGHIEFSCKKRQMILFFLTTILLWTILCISFCSYTDIGTQLNVYSRRKPFVLVEQIELQKYWLPYLVIMGNLILVTFWSLAVILGDGSLIAHYLNCWCAALHEMETSAAVTVRMITSKNLQLYIFFVLAYSFMFIFDWPGHVRGSCMLTSMLLLRPSIPLARINQPKKVLFYQWIGFVIQMYILFCSRLVMCTLQIFAQMVQNVCEMWNFKFALRFKLIAKESRGQLYQMELNHSIAKLWSHHRLVVLLLEQYGHVFSIAIMCYIIPQLCVFALALAAICRGNDVSLEQEFYDGQTHIKIYSDNAPTIKIPYYHTQLEGLFMALFIFLHVSVDFLFTTDTLTSATNAFMTGGEFVRRAGMMTADRSHERRLIYSLQWSFNPTRLHALTANRYFTLDRHSIGKLFSLIFLLFSIILRIHEPSPPIKVTFPLRGSCSKELGQTLIHGICTITGPPFAAPVPPPPPADYYFFMEHCEEIEKKYKNLVKNFEYYADPSSNAMANLPPFQICRVEIENNTRLPKELENFGRYFQDQGNARLQETLQIYFHQTYDPSKIDYLKITAATLVNHPNSTGGTYCGPDPKGQNGKLCEWVEYYRDCVVVCYSNLMSKTLLIPRMFKMVSPGHYTLYTDYSKVDCGLNPFGFKFKGGMGRDQWKVVEPAYNCFGERLTPDTMDLCWNFPVKEPISTFTPAKGETSKLLRGYSSKWLSAVKSVTAMKNPSLPAPCDKCYDNPVGIERCSDSSLVEKHCPYSRYYGARIPPNQPGDREGYYFADKCFKLNIDLPDSNQAPSPKPCGFCKWEYVDGGILIGHVVSSIDYENSKITQWTKEWNLGKPPNGDLPPCKQAGFMPGQLIPIQEHLHFKHTCLSDGIPLPGGCELDNNSPQGYFHSYRPYELLECGKKLRQIKLNYEILKGNDQLCDYVNEVMKVPENVEIELEVSGQKKKYTKFYGCQGKLLLPTKGKSYHCLSPTDGGVCEVDADTGYLLDGDCKDPEIKASKSCALNTRGGRYDYGTLAYGLCSAVIDFGDPLFKNYRLKLLTDSLVYWLMNQKAWTDVDKWQTVNVVLTKSLTLPPPPGSTDYCDDVKEHYCGSNSVPLHYPYDNYDSVVAGDKFLCNWKAYQRDCLQPFESRIASHWVYLPKWVAASTKKMYDKQRKAEPLANTFSFEKDNTGCDGRKLPADATAGTKIDSYWKDECGWIMTPEFADGDPESLAVMAPILPLGYQVFSDDGLTVSDAVIHCYDSEYSLYRCTHPDIRSVCKSHLGDWDPSDGVLDYCYRFGSDCFKTFNKKPIGFSLVPGESYPEGFCRGFCKKEDTEKDAVDEKKMFTWRDRGTIDFEFQRPPCFNKTANSEKLWDSFDTNKPFTPKPREIELRLFAEFHCSDENTENGALRDPPRPSSSFIWPMYIDKKTFTYKFVPLEPLLKHLKSKYGPSCDYLTETNEGDIYPKMVKWTDPSTGEEITVDQSDFLGCHGYPLVWFLQEFRDNKEEMKTVDGLTDPKVDYGKVCYSRLLGGWCEARIEPLIFMRDDFEKTCDGSKGSLPVECPKNCDSMTGDFLNKPLADQVQDVPGYWPFVQSKKKFVIGKEKDKLSSHSPDTTREDLPYRRVLRSQFMESSFFWSMYKDPTKHGKYYDLLLDDITNSVHKTCYHTSYNNFLANCHFYSWLQYCVVPCTIVSSPKIITQSAQSLVDETPGQGNMFLIPVPYHKNPKGGNIKYTPAWSYMDCVIDPMMTMGMTASNYQGVTQTATCGGYLIGQNDGVVNYPETIDHWKWRTYPEFLPDGTPKPNGFRKWRLEKPHKVKFKFDLLTDYYNPTVPITSVKPNDVELFVTPYFSCHRMTQEPMRMAVQVALATYQNPKYESKHVPDIYFDPKYYSYHPKAAADKNLCMETAVYIYLEENACFHLKIPSKVVPIYAGCSAIFPAINANSVYAIIREDLKGTPPLGCVSKTSHAPIFDKTWTAPRSSHKQEIKSGFGIPYTLTDVYGMWNNLCHSCAYTREMHKENAKKNWCGYKDKFMACCMSYSESQTSVKKNSKPEEKNRMIFGEGIFFKHWFNERTKTGFDEHQVKKIGSVYRIAINYFCFDDASKRWLPHARWRTYHPWSEQHENPKGADQDKPAAYLIHIAVNALNCPYPCRGPDESEDCNSKCPLKDHNPCDKSKQFKDNFKYEMSGLKYQVVLKEKNKLCSVDLAEYGKTTQGLGILGEYGTNIISRLENYTLRPDYRSVRDNIFYSLSELIMENEHAVNYANFYKRYTHIKILVIAPSSSSSSDYYTAMDMRVASYLPPIPNTSLEGPRMTALHPGYIGINITPATKPMYSTYCAALEGNDCKVDIKWIDTQGTPIKLPEDVVKDGKKKVFDYLERGFVNCTSKDEMFVDGLLNTEPNTALYGDKYCCIPYQYRRTPNNPDPKEWERIYFWSVNNTWTQCGVENDNPFGWLLGFNQNARYLSGCPYEDCKSNKCALRLRDTSTSDTDLCTRQFDPKEKFINSKIDNCELKKP